MEIKRRGFVGGLGATAASLGGAGLVRAAPARNGHTPITNAEWEAIVRTDFSGVQACVRGIPMTEGPFYYETSPLRRNIVDGKPGMRLRLGVTLGALSGVEGRCAPLAGAVVDIWHTTPDGLYSNVGKDIQPVDTSGQSFCRGHQITDEKGYVEFDTIVPGWEIVAAPPPVGAAIRTPHIHVKAFHEREVLTTQLFFPDALMDQLYAEVEPYASYKMLTAPGLDRSYARIRNGEDHFFTLAKAQPMTVERLNGVLVAKASIGVISQGNRGFETLFR